VRVSSASRPAAACWDREDTGTDRRRYDRDVSAVRAALGAETFAAAWEAGRALSLEQAIAEATDCLLWGCPSPTSASHCSHK
jgi:hypothetical protein